jgi:hypothetical protein
MLRRASEKTHTSKLRCGDLIEVVPESNWDVITAFRFFLNAEPELRASTLRELAQKLRPETGRLIFNVHGNRHSLRHFSLAWHRRYSADRANELSRKEIAALIEEAGLRVVLWDATGIFPAYFHRTPLRRVFRVLDKYLSPLFPWFGIDLLFICARAERRVPHPFASVVNVWER